MHRILFCDTRSWCILSVVEVGERRVCCEERSQRKETFAEVTEIRASHDHVSARALSSGAARSPPGGSGP